MKFIEKMKQDTRFSMILLSIIALILTIIFFFVTGFTTWFWISLVLWLIFFVKYTSLIAQFSFLVTMVIFIVVFIVSIGFMFGGRMTTKQSVKNVDKKLSAEECKPLIDKYNNKILKITGDNTIGSIGIKITADCQLSAKYILTFNANLPENPIPDLPGTILYNYVNNLHSKSETARGTYGVGALSMVRQNAMTLPDAFMSSSDIGNYYRLPTEPNNTPTSSFYWTYERMGNFSQKRYQEILDDNVFEVIDGLPYMEKQSYGDGTFSHSINTDRAEVEGKIVKTINLTIDE